MFNVSNITVVKLWYLFMVLSMGDKSGRSHDRELSLGKKGSFVDLANNNFSPGLTWAPKAPKTGTSVDSLRCSKPQGRMGCGQ